MGIETKGSFCSGMPRTELGAAQVAVDAPWLDATLKWAQLLQVEELNASEPPRIYCDCFYADRRRSAERLRLSYQLPPGRGRL